VYNKRNQRRLALVKSLYRSELISKEDMQKLLDGDPGIGIPIFTAIVIYIFKNVLGIDLEMSSSL